FDQRWVILQRKRHAEIAGESRCFVQGVAAPGPGLVAAEFLMLGFPDSFRDVVAAAAFGAQRYARPRQEYAHDLHAEIGRHAQQLAHIDELRLAMLGNRAAEIVIGGDGVDLDAGVGSFLAQFTASGGGHIQRIAMRALAVDLDSLVAELCGSLDDLLECESAAAVPEAAVGDAVEADLNFGARVLHKSILSFPATKSDQ